MAKQATDLKSVGQIILYSVIALAVVAFIVSRIMKYVSSKKPDAVIKNGADNPDNYYNDMHSAGQGLQQNQYTLATVDSTGKIQPTDLLIKILLGLETELFATFYTSDANVSALIENCKTVGDLALLNKIWNGTISEKHGGALLLSSMKKNMFSGAYDKAMSYLNALPDTI
jgi:hypothetical protein